MNRRDSLILDTHVWVWWINQDNKLSVLLRERIAQASYVAISAVSVYELVQAVERRRLSLAVATSEWLQSATVGGDIQVIAVDGEIARVSAELPSIHGDPLDRMIMATALVRSQPLISLDRRFAAYPKISELLIRR